MEARRSIVSIGQACLLAFVFGAGKVQCGGPKLATDFVGSKENIISLGDGGFFTIFGFGDGAAAGFTVIFSSSGSGTFFPLLTGLGITVYAFLAQFLHGPTKLVHAHSRGSNELLDSVLLERTLSVDLGGNANKLHFGGGGLDLKTALVQENSKAVVSYKMAYDPSKVEVKAL